jgi:hypothetical protein
MYQSGFGPEKHAFHVYVMWPGIQSSIEPSRVSGENTASATSAGVIEGG